MAMAEAKSNPTLAVQSDSRPSPPSDQKTAIAAAIVAEPIATRCVARTTECIDRLRTIFDPASSGKTIRRPNGATEATVAAAAAAVGVTVVDHDDLWSHFSTLQDDVSNLYDEAVSNLYNPNTTQSKGHDASQAWYWLDVTNRRHCEAVIASKDDVRYQVVYTILLPLLATLGMCYEILDAVVEPINSNDNANVNDGIDTTADTTMTTPPTDGKVSNLQPISQDPVSTGTPPSATTPSRPQRPPRPTPPRGLLSIQNYTNIACCIEWITCWTIVWIMPAHVLLSIDHRLRFELPKSLRGRISPLCLSWPWHQTPEPQTKERVDRDFDSLEAVVRIAGRLLLLDRFRPMLLPRHLPDLMAAILLHRHVHCPSSRRRQELRNENHASAVSSAMERISSHLLGGGCSSMNNSLAPSPLSLPRIDIQWQVISYQTLLRHGRDAPAWLQAQVSPLLCHVAATQLASLVAVFVPTSNGGGSGAVAADATAAVARLARAIVPPKQQPNVNSSADTAAHAANQTTYLQSICRQLVLLLDGAIHSSLSSSTSSSIYEWMLQPHDAINLCTVWSVVDLMPDHILDNAFCPFLLEMESGGDVDARSDKADWTGFHKVALRLAILLLGRPPSLAVGSGHYAVSKVLCLFLKPWSVWADEGRVDTTECLQSTVFGVLVRLASTRSVIQSTIKQDAMCTVRLFVQATVECNFASVQGGTKNGGSVARPRVPGVVVAAIALLYAIAPSEWDFSGRSFEFRSDPKSNESTMEQLWLGRDAATPSREQIVESVTSRARLVLEDIAVDHIKSSDQNQLAVNDKGRFEQLPSLLFQILLASYFAADLLAGPADSDASTSLFRHHHFQIVPLVCLPLLCDVCPLEHLFNLGGDTGILDTIKMVLESVISRYAANELQPSDKREIMVSSVDDLRVRLSSASAVMHFEERAEPEADQVSGDANGFGGGADDEMMLSVASIVLTLLVSILELGEQQRTTKEECTLQSFSAPLRAMAAMAPNCQSTSDAAVQLGQLSEMASYAAALIATRSFPSESSPTVRPDSAFDLLASAESDLNSTEPPLRARGMVQLRKLVHSLEQFGNGNGQEDPIETLWKILHLSVRALDDAESYVYLAAIHTIVAVAEFMPSVFVKVLGATVATGVVDTKLGMDDLSWEQRLKLTEALSFIVRRRGSYDTELLFLFEILACGPAPSKAENDESHSDSIQAMTHDYFVDQSVLADETEMEYQSADEYWEGVQLRVRTGGPLFSLEEIDTVRAATISLVSDLVSVVGTETVARYGSILMDCCITTLRLESSRPVRRASALLARELYAALVRELDGLVETSINRRTTSSIPLGAGMATGREQILYSVMQRIAASDDLNDEIRDKTDARHGRLYDPATVARCQEAIHLRLEAEAGGILQAGLVAAEAALQENHGVARLLQSSQLAKPIPPSVMIEEVL